MANGIQKEIIFGTVTIGYNRQDSPSLLDEIFKLPFYWHLDESNSGLTVKWEWGVIVNVNGLKLSIRRIEKDIRLFLSESRQRVVPV